jgi:cell wall-associated NlpC family hydrolase
MTRYRKRWRYRRRLDSRSAGAAVIAGVALAALAHGGAAAISARARGTVPSHAAAQAIAFARAQLGKPYVYGATGPGAYDCSGLVMQAWSAAGVPIPRTSEEQWAALPHVTTPEPGDLVFFTGSPIDAPPGHVGLVIGPHLMIDAYATGYPVQVQSYGLPSSAPGLADPWGFVEPGGGP